MRIVANAVLYAASHTSVLDAEQGCNIPKSDNQDKVVQLLGGDVDCLGAFI